MDGDQFRGCHCLRHLGLRHPPARDSFGFVLGFILLSQPRSTAAIGNSAINFLGDLVAFAAQGHMDQQALYGKDMRISEPTCALSVAASAKQNNSLTIRDPDFRRDRTAPAVRYVPPQ